MDFKTPSTSASQTNSTRSSKTASHASKGSSPGAFKNTKNSSETKISTHSPQKPTTNSSKTKHHNSSSKSSSHDREPSSSNKHKKSSRSSSSRRKSSSSSHHSKYRNSLIALELERASHPINSIFDFFFHSRDRVILLLSITVLLPILYYNNATSNIMKKYYTEEKFTQEQQESTDDQVAEGEEEEVVYIEEDYVPVLNGLKNVWDYNEVSDVPIFWHIAKSGGTSIKNVLSKCYSKTLASEVGIRDGHADDTKIQVFMHGGFPYVNIDTSTTEGIERARHMNFMWHDIKGLAIVSPWVHDIEQLFVAKESTGRGRIFGMFRHPIDRAVSMYHYLQYATWEPSYNPLLKNMTLEQYAESEFIENNFVTRILTGKYFGELTSDDAMMATVILKRKILVGLQSKIMESMERYEKFFGWTYDTNYNISKECSQQILSVGSNVNINKQGNLRSSHALPKEDSRAHKLLYHHNRFDIQIYTVAESMFEEQKSLMNNVVPPNINNEAFVHAFELDINTNIDSNVI